MLWSFCHRVVCPCGASGLSGAIIAVARTAQLTLWLIPPVSQPVTEWVSCLTDSTSQPVRDGQPGAPRVQSGAYRTMKSRLYAAAAHAPLTRAHNPSPTTTSTVCTTHHKADINQS